MNLNETGRLRKIGLGFLAGGAAGVMAMWIAFSHGPKFSRGAVLETGPPLEHVEAADTSEHGTARSPLGALLGAADAAASAPTRWRNPHREHAGMVGPGLYGQKYHAALIPPNGTVDTILEEVEWTQTFNPEKVALSAVERSEFKAALDPMLRKWQLAKGIASDTVRQAADKKQKEGDYAEGYPPGVRHPPMDDVLAKYQGGRNDRVTSLRWKDGGFGAIVLTPEDSPQVFESKAVRGAAFDEMIEYIFSFFEDATNRRR